MWSYSSNQAAILALVTFICYVVGLEKEMRLYIFFIPIRMKAKYIIWMMAIFPIISAIFNFYGGLDSLVGLIGIYIGKRIYDYVNDRTVSTRFF